MKRITALLLAFLLVGCEEKTEVFGIEIGGELQSVRDQGIVTKEDLIPSKHNFLSVDLNKAPKSEFGDMAKYSVSAMDGEIIGATARLEDSDGHYFESLVGYATKVLGNPIATEVEINDLEKVRVSPYKCVQNKSCPTPKYAVFRNGSLNAMVSSGDGKSVLQFDSDKIKEALNLH